MWMEMVGRHLAVRLVAPEPSPPALDPEHHAAEQGRLLMPPAGLKTRGCPASSEPQSRDVLSHPQSRGHGTSCVIFRATVTECPASSSELRSQDVLRLQSRGHGTSWVIFRAVVTAGAD